MKRKVILMLLCATAICLSSCLGNSSQVENDNVSKEQALNDTSVIIETNAQEEFFDGYTAPDGSRQIPYQGSQEQKRDLEMIDAYFNEHG